MKQINAKNRSTRENINTRKPESLERGVCVTYTISLPRELKFASPLSRLYLRITLV